MVDHGEIFPVAHLHLMERFLQVVVAQVIGEVEEHGKEHRGAQEGSLQVVVQIRMVHRVATAPLNQQVVLGEPRPMVDPEATLPRAVALLREAAVEVFKLRVDRERGTAAAEVRAHMWSGRIPSVS